VIRETGETHRSEGSGLDADLGRRLRWESDGEIVLMKPGNAICSTMQWSLGASRSTFATHTSDILKLALEPLK